MNKYGLVVLILTALAIAAGVIAGAPSWIVAVASGLWGIAAGLRLREWNHGGN